MLYALFSIGDGVGGQKRALILYRRKPRNNHNNINHSFECADYKYFLVDTIAAKTTNTSPYKPGSSAFNYTTAHNKDRIGADFLTYEDRGARKPKNPICSFILAAIFP